MIVRCTNNVPESDFVTKISRDLFQLDKDFYSDKTLPLMSQTEQKIEAVYNSGLPSCAQEFVNKLEDTTANDPNNYYTFKFFWLSLLSGLKDCNTNTDACMIENGDDNTFLIRYIQSVISVAVQFNDFSCFVPTDKNCTDSLKAIVEQGFTSAEYDVQIETLKVALNGVEGHLEKSYSDWAEGNKECEELIIEICLGKNIFLPLTVWIFFYILFKKNLVFFLRFLKEAIDKTNASYYRYIIHHESEYNRCDDKSRSFHNSN